MPTKISLDTMEVFKKDTIDVGILVTPIHENGILEEVLFYEEMKVLASKSHELSNKKTVNVEELESPDLWLLNNGHCFRSQVVNLCNYKKKNDTKWSLYLRFCSRNWEIKPDHLTRWHNFKLYTRWLFAIINNIIHLFVTSR